MPTKQKLSSLERGEIGESLIQLLDQIQAPGRIERIMAQLLKLHSRERDKWIAFAKRIGERCVCGGS
jgi:hypothetical protein